MDKEQAARLAVHLDDIKGNDQRTRVEWDEGDGRPAAAYVFLSALMVVGAAVVLLW